MDGRNDHSQLVPSFDGKESYDPEGREITDINACNSMYAEYIRNTTKMTESWLDSFSKFWSVQFKDKAKVE